MLDATHTTSRDLLKIFRSYRARIAAVQFPSFSRSRRRHQLGSSGISDGQWWPRNSERRASARASTDGPVYRDVVPAKESPFRITFREAERRSRRTSFARVSRTRVSTSPGKRDVRFITPRRKLLPWPRTVPHEPPHRANRDPAWD